LRKRRRAPNCSNRCISWQYTDPIDLARVVGVDWDAGNARRNERRGVTQVEAEDVFFDPRDPDPGQTIGDWMCRGGVLAWRWRAGRSVLPGETGGWDR
jgi:hypothetical protein